MGKTDVPKSKERNCFYFRNNLHLCNAGKSFRLLLTMILVGVFISAGWALYQDPAVDNEFARWQFIPRTYQPFVDPNGLHFFSKTTDWKTLIDQAWGPGLPTAQKLQFFDQFWEAIDDSFACFHDLTVDWHGLRNRYRPEVAAGVSQGRFAAIMNHLSMSLRESHTSFIRDSIVNYQTKLIPGVPLLWVGGWGNDYHFGAGLTPLSDKSLLVYNTVPDHPLGLEPGDIVLGYEGTPWKDLYPQLLAAELPVTGSWWGSCPSAFEHSLLMGAGDNWHLFNTINVRKFHTKEIVNLPTSLLAGKQMSIFATEQLPVPGVPMLTLNDLADDKFVKWGFIEDTDIGYVYVMAWYGASLSSDLYQAVDSIVKDPKTKGLIIDFRINYGGNMHLINQTLPLLFQGRISTIGWGVRANINDHTAMSINPVNEPDFDIVGSSSCPFTRPIAVLVGPGAVSSGDQNALRMTFHPRAKLFGRSTSAAFNSPTALTVPAGWNACNATADAYVVSHRGHFLTHNELKVDFPVWLAPHDAAVQRDTVAAAAVAWINYKNNGYTDCLQTRWIPHITEPASGFNTRFIFNNLADDPAVMEIRPYDEQGGALSRQTVVVQGRGLQQLSAEALFPHLTASHFSICGPETCKVTAVYQVASGDGAAAPSHERGATGTEFIIYPDDWSRILDGVGIVNPNSEPVTITASLVSREGVETKTVTLVDDLPRYAKVLTLLSNILSNPDGQAIKITASQPVCLLSLRVNPEGTVLYEVQCLQSK